MWNGSRGKTGISKKIANYLQYFMTAMFTGAVHVTVAPSDIASCGCDREGAASLAFLLFDKNVSDKCIR